MTTAQTSTTAAMPQQNLYRVLNVSQTASAEEVKKAIIQGSRLWSNRTNAPQIEKRQEAERMVKLIEEAETLLLDPAKRAGYDRQLATAPCEEREVDESDLAERGDLVKEAWRLLSEGEVPDAMFVAEKATQRDANNAEAWAVLAQAKARWGETEDAIYEFKRAIKLRPNEASYYFDFGSVLESAGKTADALQQYQRAAQVDPATPMYRAGVGAMLVKLQNYKEGIEILERCRQEQPDNPTYQRFLAIGYMGCVWQGWTQVPQGHPHLEEGPYATEYEHIVAARSYLDKACALKFDDPELMKDIQYARAELENEVKRKFTGSWFAAIVVGLVGLALLGIPTVIAVLYVISAYTPQYKIHRRMLQGKVAGDFALIAKAPALKEGEGIADSLLKVAFQWALMILLMPIMTVVNFVRNYATK
jgi:tetratricopeptide (TPR) repeat protein